jgi:hypothetical protein
MLIKLATFMLCTTTSFAQDDQNIIGAIPEYTQNQPVTDQSVASFDLSFSSVEDTCISPL